MTTKKDGISAPDGSLYITLTDGNGTLVTPGSGSGSVTSVSVATANGVSGSVATPTTTPDISLTLGAITPTSVNGNTIASGSGTLTFQGTDTYVGRATTDTLTNKTLTSPTLTTPSLGAATATTVTFSPTTGGIVGTTTNNNTNAGNVGEYVSSSIAAGSAVSLTTTIQANITNISLTAGDWEVFGVVLYKGGATTVINYLQGGATSTSASITEPYIFSQFLNGTVPFGTITALSYAIPTQRFSLNATTTIYLVANGGFTTSTLSAYGAIWARRRR